MIEKRYSIEELKEVIAPIAEKYHLSKVYLFGSFARGDYNELSDIDLRIDVAEAAVHGVRPFLGRHAQHVMDVVVLHQELHEARVLIILRSFERLDLGKRRLIHRGLQDLLCVVVVLLAAGHHVGDDEALEVLLMGEGVFHRQDSAPG